MEQIFRKLNGTEYAFNVWTQEEAEKEEIAFKPWKDCQPGEYGLSDDGYVGICLKRKFYPDKRRKSGGATVIFMIYGGAWLNKKSYISYIERRDTNSFTRTVARTSDDLNARRTSTKAAVFMAAQQFIQNGKIDYDFIGQKIRPDQASPGATMRRLFKSKRVQKMLEQRITEALKPLGITEATVVERLDEAYMMAHKKQDLPNMLRSTENFRDILQMKQPSVKVTQIDELEEHRLTAIDGKIDAEITKSTKTKVIDGVPAQMIEEGKGNGQGTESPPNPGT